MNFMGTWHIIGSVHLGPSQMRITATADKISMETCLTQLEHLLMWHSAMVSSRCRSNMLIQQFTQMFSA